MRVRRPFERLVVGSIIVGCGLSTRAGKNRCAADDDCLAPKQCFEGICRLHPPDCEGEDCPSDGGGQSGEGNGARGGTSSEGVGGGGVTGGTAGNGSKGSGGSQGGTGNSGGSRPESGAGGTVPGGSASEGGNAGKAGNGSSGAGGSGGCNQPASWVDVDLLPVPTRGVAATTLSRGLARVGEDDCLGILFVSNALVTPNCPLTSGDTVVFDKVRIGGEEKPPVQNVVISILETRSRHAIPVIRNVSHVDRPPVPWAARSPLRGETLTAISYGIDGFAKAITLAIPPETFETSTSSENEGARAAIYGSDGKFLGFCRIDSCGEAFACVSMGSLVHDSPTLPEYLGMQGVHWGDMTGNGTSDGVAITLGYVSVAPSTATGLGGAEFWLSESYKGRLDSLLGDLDGDGLADLVRIDAGGVSARRSTGKGFGPNSLWTADSFDTYQHVALADVDGVAGDDLVSVFQREISVWLSRGNVFGPMAVWATLPSGFGDGWFSDVTGDGRADAVFAGANELIVLESIGDAFGTPTTWLTGESAVAPGWFFADISGDRMADALAIDAAGVRLFLSDGKEFSSAGPLTVLPTIGERGNSVADVNGDRKADVVTHHNKRILAFLSTGTDFNPSVLWYDELYLGGI